MLGPGEGRDLEFQIEDFSDLPHECPSQSTIFVTGQCLFCAEPHGQHANEIFCEQRAQSKADLMGLRWAAWNTSGQPCSCTCGDEFGTPLELAFHRAAVHAEAALNDTELAVLAARALD